MTGSLARYERYRRDTGQSFLTVPVVLFASDKGNYGSVGGYLFSLRPGIPGDLDDVRGLLREAAEWLRTKGIDQWANPWPDPVGHQERILSDLLKGNTWIAWDDSTAAGTITVDAEEPLDLNERPLWPSHKRGERALYVRRVVVSRRYGGLGLGAALLDWAAHVAKRDHGAEYIRVDVWTTNADLHGYYTRQRFVREEGRDPRELDGYPSQALFERKVDKIGNGYARFFTNDPC